MNPNQTKGQDRTAYGQKPQTNPRDKQRNDKSAARPERRDGLNDPVGTPETNRPLKEGDLEPRWQPRDDEDESREPGCRTDVLKPGR